MKCFEKEIRKLSIIFIQNVHGLTLCIQKTPKRELLQTCEVPDEMQHNAAFHLVLQCL